ncbi:putative bromodomain-containing protein 10 isoform X3 [Rhinolophus sinicus]|uniref:putative bromodomain-containing protein 10 isoform X3 n=1 Tax=Rhinolophus sinicus TaxID=89399 RepID=UPI003D7B12A4
MSVPETPGEMEPAGEEERPPPAAEEEDDEEVAAAARASGPAQGRSASSRESAEDQEEEVQEAMVVEGGGCKEQELTYELQQGYRILGEFLQEKHRGLTAPFLQPLGGVATWEEEEAEGPRSGGRGSRSLPQQPGQGMCLLKMEEKFTSGQYGGITEFVADFRSMLEMCYRLHGVDHWMSRQGQKLEMMLEQKLALLSRHLREKTTIAVTSRGYYGLEDEKGTACTSTRRRSTTRSLAGLTSGVFESIMVQVLRQEEQLRAKEEKRLREQERKEAEEASQKEVEEWERKLLAQAAPTCMETMWEIPAIGHFLCLAQQILNLPEIVFYELERCLLMPQCNAFLSKIMTSLLSPPHRRPTLHRKPTLPYRTWEAALRQKVQQWYTAVGQTENPNNCAEKLGLCPQFFKVLGGVNPLEEKPFHELSFHQKVWLLKGLCDFVYETQKEVQDAVLGQPIHECREVILGYDYLENAYVHFPQFCGADVRIYKQRPFQAPEFPIPPIKIQRVPRIKLEKFKCDYFSTSNGEHKCGRESLPSSFKKEQEINFDPTCYPDKMNLDNHDISFEMEVKSNCEIRIRRPCEIKKTDCCKENLEKPGSPGEVTDFGEPLSPGEIRFIEKQERYGEASRVKPEPSSFKENALKSCQIHVNGSHSDHPEINCHKVVRDILLEQSLQSHKKLKLTKMRAKKKKKKKKKLKDVLNENLQRKREGLHSLAFKSYKPEIQNKLLIIKKKAKHKKHKSGKKSISKKAVTKKRKTVIKTPTVPEFQGKWYHRRQAVKELHSTLIRLLNELLPWEPKLLKAFQRNRSRLKKDYDDFRRHPDHEKFTRELWTTEEGEGDPGKESPKIEISKSIDSTEPLDILEKDHFDSDDMKLSEIDFPMARSKLLKKELPSKDVLKTLPKTLKRQSKQTSYLDDSTKELSPRKKAKLSTNETTVENAESDMQIDCLNASKHTEPLLPESFASVDSTPVSTLQKGTKPIQALLAKNIGNKVTLTNQLPLSTGRSASAIEKPVISPPEASPIKPALTCHTNTKGPLQMVYKMPCGQWLPIDLHNSSVKIQMQPVLDPKTGEKIMQQVLILPKNFVIQHKEGRAVAKEIPPLQQKGTEQHCLSFPQTANTNSSLASVLANSAGAVSTHLPNAVFNKTITPLSNLSNARPQPLPPVSSVSNLLPPVKNSQSEAGKVKNAVLAATFPQPIASPTISSTVQPLLSATTLSGSTNPGSSLNCFAQQTADSSEVKQELKTVCIRDSQSILVRTRGGNTGVVKVQTNPDQNSPNSLSPSSVFTFAPQLQAFLVPKSTTSSSSAFSPVSGTTAASSLPPFGQTPTSVSIPAGFNPSLGKNLKLTLGQPSYSGNLAHIIDKTSHTPSSPLKSSVSSSTLLPSTASSSVGILSLSTGNFGQTNANVIHTPTKQQQVDYITKSQPVTRSEATAATNGDVISGTTVQKLMLVSAPPVLSSGSGTAITVTPAPTPTGVSAQKLVFINAPVPSGTSTPTIVAEPLKQTLPPPLNKTYVKAPEQPQIVLIPSTVGAPIKINSSPTVSQIKDVKIGLNIGQAIVNTSGSVPAVPSINILQKVTPKGEEKSTKGYVLPLSTSGNSIPVSSNFVSQNITPVNESVVSAARAVNMFSVTGANVSLGSLSVTSTSASVGTRPPVLVSGNDTSSRIMPILSNRLCTSNLGNTVAISTVKTGHLASSVLISTTQPTVSPKCLTSALQIPVTVALPTPVTISPKIINTVPQVATVPGTTHSVSLSKRQSRTSVQFQSPGISATVPTNINTNKPQTELPSLSPNPGKIINISNFSSLPNQQMSPALVKPTSSYSSTPGGSAVHTATAPSNVTGVGGGQFSEPCIQQKIVINTSTPLAPGTQIMINGTRFIVPPQGLGAGSHVLLISTNPKYGPPLVFNSGHGIQPTPVDNPGQKITLASNNSLSGQPVKQSLRTSTKIVNSLGNASSLPTVHTTPQIVNTTAKVSVPPPVSTVSLTSVIKSPPATLLAKTSLVSAICSSSPPLPSSTSVFHLDTSVKKLLVSPEGAILNTINTPASKVSSLSSSLSQIVVSASRNPASVFPAFQSSGLEKPDTAAS